MPIAKKISVAGSGHLSLNAAANTTLITAGTYYKIAGTFDVGLSRLFSAATNKIKWNGPSGARFLFNGSSDLAVDKLCEITYSLYCNGLLVPGAQTPHTFVALAKTVNISITAIIALNHGDELDVYAKSNADNTLLTVRALGITFWGESK